MLSVVRAPVIVALIDPHRGRNVHFRHSKCLALCGSQETAMPMTC